MTCFVFVWCGQLIVIGLLFNICVTCCNEPVCPGRPESALKMTYRLALEKQILISLVLPILTDIDQIT